MSRIQADRRDALVSSRVQLVRFVAVVALALIPVSPACSAVTSGERMDFIVMRDGQQIGTSTIDVQSNNIVTTVQIATHVSVKLAFINLYRFDQTETEHWSHGQLLAMNATTNDDGDVHTVRASNSGDGLVVDVDGVTRKIAQATAPLSLWSPTLLSLASALSTTDGTVTPLKVADMGQDAVAIHGVSSLAHHYAVMTTFPEDLWYDSSGHLVQMVLKVHDGSTVRYELA
jgi:hypothetical protein